MEKTNPLEFLRQVRQEVMKVTWPTRKETLVTTGMVFLMVTLSALFFSLVDIVMQAGVKALFGIGG
jgi:preprotein translocase subunit SecE